MTHPTSSLNTIMKTSKIYKKKNKNIVEEEIK